MNNAKFGALLGHLYDRAEFEALFLLEICSCLRIPLNLEVTETNYNYEQAMRDWQEFYGKTGKGA